MEEEIGGYLIDLNKDKQSQFKKAKSFAEKSQTDNIVSDATAANSSGVNSKVSKASNVPTTLTRKANLQSNLFKMSGTVGSMLNKKKVVSPQDFNQDLKMKKMQSSPSKI